MENLSAKKDPREARSLLTEVDVAKWLNVSHRTIQNWRWRGGGPAFMKLGNSVRYDPDVIEAWIAARSKGSTSAPSGSPPCNMLQTAEPRLSGGEREA